MSHQSLLDQLKALDDQRSSTGTPVPVPPPAAPPANTDPAPAKADGRNEASPAKEGAQEAAPPPRRPPSKAEQDLVVLRKERARRKSAGDTPWSCPVCRTEEPGTGEYCVRCGHPRGIWTAPTVLVAAGAVGSFVLCFLLFREGMIAIPSAIIGGLMLTRFIGRKRRLKRVVAKDAHDDLVDSEREKDLLAKIGEEKKARDQAQARLEAAARCPFCFTSVQLKEYLVRAAGIPVPDPVVQRHLGLPMAPAMPPLCDTHQTWMQWGSWWERSDRKRSPHRDPVCPSCHLHVPSNPLDRSVRQVVVTMVGGRSAGKSVYLAVLLREIQDRLCQVLGYSCTSASTYSIQGANLERLTSEQLSLRRFNSIYQTVGATVLDQTQSARVDAQIRLPFVFHLIPTNAPGGLARTVELVIYDLAGEDLQSEAGITQGAQSIFHSDLILLVADPFEQEALHSLMAPSDRDANKRVGVRAGSVLSDVISILQRERHLAPAQQISACLAVTMSKFDRVRALVEEGRCDLLERESVLLRPSATGQFDEQQSRSIDSETRAFWQRIADHRLISLLPRFERSRCFVSSALASTVAGSVQIQPERVEDPLIWCLRVNNLLREG